MAKKCELTGVGIMTGHNVSKSKRRTNRDFLPNLKEVTLKSDVLGVTFSLKIMTSILRTINKYGNLDSFIINYKFNKLTDKAKSIRRKIKNVMVEKGVYDEIKIIKHSKHRAKKIEA